MISSEELLRHAATFHQAGQYAEAEELYRGILHAEPGHPDANHNLGLLALQQGQPERALPFLQMAWEADPSVGQYWLTLTECLLALGSFGDALSLVNDAIKRGMKTPQAQRLRLLAKRGQDRTAPSPAVAEEVMALFRTGRNAELEQRMRPLLEEFPGWILGWSALGAAMQLQGKEAESTLRYAAQLAPHDAEVQNNLGAFLRKHGRFDEAVECLQAAVKLRPEFAEAHLNLGITLSDLGRFDQAFDALQRALSLMPEYVEALYAMGAALNQAYRFEDALGYFQRALEVKPNHWDAHNEMAIALHGLGRTSEAVDCYRKLLEGNPESTRVYSNLLFCLSHDESIGAEEIFREHCKYGDRFETPLRGEWGGYLNTPDPERPLHVGFVSADFFHHAVANFIEPIVRHMASNPGFVLHAYSNRAIEDETTLRLKGYLPRWNRVDGLSDEELARKIRADGIDILVDLSGHTGHNRLLTFARKPAPVQVSWIGYPGTTGLQGMDYYLADRFFLPAGKFDSQFTEKIVRLPAVAPFDPFPWAPSVNDLPALSRGYVTFGSFNRVSKINNEVVALWASLMNALPNSLMLLGGLSRDGNHDALIRMFEQQGVSRERLLLHPRSDMDAYLALHHQVDICLDTFPYNGATTTCHAAWMGVPTLTLEGRGIAGRQGAAILGHFGLEEFVVRDASEFVRRGVKWCENLDQLAKVRQETREYFAGSARGRSDLIVTGLELGLRTMWRRWCAGLTAESFDVDVS